MWLQSGRCTETSQIWSRIPERKRQEIPVGIRAEKGRGRKEAGNGGRKEGGEEEREEAANTGAGEKEGTGLCSTDKAQVMPYDTIRVSLCIVF